MTSLVDSRVTFDTVRVVQSIVRPANTTAYSAGDCVSASDDSHFEFPRTTKRLKFTGLINGAICLSNANVATKPDLELWLFRKDIANVADNSAFAPTDTEMGTLVAVIPFAVANWLQGHSGANATGNSVCVNHALAAPFRCGDADEPLSLFGQLVIRNAYVPVSSETFTVELMISQD